MQFNANSLNKIETIIRNTLKDYSDSLVGSKLTNEFNMLVLRFSKPIHDLNFNGVDLGNALTKNINTFTMQSHIGIKFEVDLSNSCIYLVV